MEIGSRLKKARTEMGLTQEKVAEEIGVSRQSISNWENNRSYPDIISVIKLSDLYSVSLDELLKEDRKMIRHLENTAKAAENNKRYAGWVLLGAYAAVWILYIPIFWLADSVTIFNFGEDIYQLFYPWCTGIIAALVGLGGHFGMWKWLGIPINGIMCILSCGATWELDHNLFHLRVLEYKAKTEHPFVLFDFPKEYLSDVEWYQKGAPLVGMAAAAIGLLIGSFIRYLTIVKRIERNENNNADNGL